MYRILLERSAERDLRRLSAAMHDIKGSLAQFLWFQAERAAINCYRWN